MSQRVKHSELVFDMSLYPREEVDVERAAHLAEVLQAGHALPPIIVDQRKRVVDGFHRARAYLIAQGADAEIPCELREYDSERDVLLDAIRRNAGHGKPFSGSDRQRCVALAQRHGVSVESLADVLNVRVQRVTSLSQTSRPSGAVTTTTARKPWGSSPDRMSKAAIDFQAPVGLQEINAVISALRTHKVDTRDPVVQESLRNLARVALESLKARAAA